MGPVSLTYKGTASFKDRDEADRSVLVEASGKEMRGSGTASATVRAALRPENGSSPASATVVTLHTTLNVTGRPAQFGRGVITEVGSRLIDRFADNLAQQLASGAVTVPATDGGAAASASAAPPAAPAGEATAPPASVRASAPAPAVAAARPSPQPPAPLPHPPPPPASRPARLQRRLNLHLADLHRHSRPARLRRHIHRSSSLQRRFHFSGLPEDGLGHLRRVGLFGLSVLGSASQRREGSRLRRDSPRGRHGRPRHGIGGTFCAVGPRPRPVRAGARAAGTGAAPG